jgi:hypothetical protein
MWVYCLPDKKRECRVKGRRSSFQKREKVMVGNPRPWRDFSSEMGEEIKNQSSSDWLVGETAHALSKRAEDGI